MGSPEEGEAEPPKPLAIYDTGIVLQATLSPFGIAEQALTQAEIGVVDAVMSNRLRAEYERVLRDLALLDKYKAILHNDDIDIQMKRLDAIIVQVSNPPHQIDYKRDPDDADTINLAIFYQADFIVARDKDLLALNHDAPFQKRSPCTQIVTPLEFVQEVARISGVSLPVSGGTVMPGI